MEVLGNTTDPALHMKIDYCGVWGYRPKCTEVIELLEKDLQKKFQFHLEAGTVKSGKFEISVYKNGDLSDEPTVVHSKM